MNRYKRPNSSYLGIILLIINLTVLNQCQNWEDFKKHLKPPEHKSFLEKYTDYITLAYFAEQNHALYRYIPINGQPASSINADQFADPYFNRNNSMKKLVLVHGWDFLERNNLPPTDKFTKVSNLLGTWGQALGMVNTNVASVQTYEIYVFTYRTSDFVENNGRRFIDTLNLYFSSTDTVIILAHSMGGLVTRSGLYHTNNVVDIIDNVVSLGTPYYGSPFASSSYQSSNLSVLSQLVGFMTGTEGGGNLAYTNGGLVAGATVVPLAEIISGAQNFYLENLIAQSSKDGKVSAYYGDMACNDMDSTAIYTSGCTFLNGGSPSFGATDGIVTTTSGHMNGRFGARAFATTFDHAQLSFRNSNTTNATNHFTTVIGYIDGL
ncbi:hypothetical protein CH373_05745 [Leptospira perolatii]|uniref:GPI inositol-deacylase PGAP1-like alpha/beta domain-containing protein n=1 Tax=Leptospira perolatii TaxID=2023191 RepID=A0A2M9ZR40_9LEPT|nr:hypothetical protein [Leptospira perolatii]PJZ70567.1 hypothetical protein CH360_06165 [Leptospira perolatii]PJZ74403.1 hypothetical protein CH373_05745 [Leptospira perolatii]